MAKNNGIFPLSGTVGNVTFVSTKHGNIARGKSNIDRERVLEDPAFEGSRQASAEFGVVSGAGKMLRKALGPTAGFARSPETHNNLNKLLMLIKEADTEHEKGKRILQPRHLRMLKGFEWNKGHPMSTVFMGNLIIKADREKRVVTVSFPEIRPFDHVKQPNGATHYQMKAVVASLDFSQQELPKVDAFSEKYLHAEFRKESITLKMELPGDGEGIYCVGIGIGFFEQIGQALYGLKGGSGFVIAEII